MGKPRYKIDLAAQMAECEINYARVMKLLPDIDSVDRRDFAVQLAGEKMVRFTVRVKERCKYTTMLEIKQHDKLLTWAPPSQFSLRVYHDARMAEVVSYRHQHRFNARYEYPNEQMYQCDEKAQLNNFLGEWLQHCLHHGHALDDPADTEPCEISKA